jgi:hypothetical protein
VHFFACDSTDEISTCIHILADCMHVHIGRYEGSMETLRMESRRKCFVAQLESLRMERLRMERIQKLLAQNGITQNGKTQNGKTQKDIKPQLESCRMERLRMERLRNTLSPNWNHSEWKESE